MSGSKSFILFFFLGTSCLNNLPAQHPLQLKNEVDLLIANNKQYLIADAVIVFTGSSSIRLWTDLQTTFPKHSIVNFGFGGSQMSDLLYYTDKLIIPFHPKQIFIYEGDNDISFGKTPEQIISTADSILVRIRSSLPESEIIFISAKPSLSRWHLKQKYEAYNGKLRSWASTQKNVQFVDVWTPMLDAEGNVMKDVFISDGLHMNKKGYAIWARVLGKYLLPASK